MSGPHQNIDGHNYVDNDIESGLEESISSYVGHYEVDKDFIISEARKLIKNKDIEDRILDMFSSYELDIYEDGKAKMVVNFKSDPWEFTSTVNMEFGYIMDDSIVLKMKKDDSFMNLIFEKKEIEGNESLVSEYMGTTSYFKKIR